MTEEKITDGLNDRPRDASIGQSAGGLPDDSSQPIDVDDRTIEDTKRKLMQAPDDKLKQEVREQENASSLGSE